MEKRSDDIQKVKVAQRDARTGKFVEKGGVPPISLSTKSSKKK